MRPITRIELGASAFFEVFKDEVWHRTQRGGLFLWDRGAGFAAPEGEVAHGGEADKDFSEAHAQARATADASGIVADGSEAGGLGEEERALDMKTLGNNYDII